MNPLEYVEKYLNDHEEIPESARRPMLLAWLDGYQKGLELAKEIYTEGVHA